VVAECVHRVVLPLGKRLQSRRQQVGMSRPVLAGLVGGSTSTFGRTAHEQLPDVARSLASYPMTRVDGPVDVAGLLARVAQT
jgi:hypothetical protein